MCCINGCLGDIERCFIWLNKLVYFWVLIFCIFCDVEKILCVFYVVKRLILIFLFYLVEKIMINILNFFLFFLDFFESVILWKLRVIIF